MQTPSKSVVPQHSHHSYCHLHFRGLSVCFLNLMIFLLLLHWSSKWAFSQFFWVLVFVLPSSCVLQVYCPRLRAGAELHCDLCEYRFYTQSGLMRSSKFAKWHALQQRWDGDAKIMKVAFSGESKIHIMILKGKRERGWGRKGVNWRWETKREQNHFTSEIKWSCH